MKLLVKICGLRSRVDVSAAVAAGADALGFVFAESVRRVTPTEARAAVLAAPSNVLRVAVMRHPARHEWQQVLEVFSPDVLQTDIEDFADLEVPESVTRWPVIREGSGASGRTLPAAFLYEGRNSGRGETVDWAAAAEIATRGQMILAGGLNASNVADAIRIVRPYGVDVSSAVEATPGEKDPTMIRNFINAARAAEVYV